jgi:hypothetical protein
MISCHVRADWVGKGGGWCSGNYMLRANILRCHLLAKLLKVYRIYRHTWDYILLESRKYFIRILVSGSSTLILQSSFYIRLVSIAASIKVLITLVSASSQPAHLSYLSNLSTPWAQPEQPLSNLSNLNSTHLTNEVRYWLRACIILLL